MKKIPRKKSTDVAPITIQEVSDQIWVAATGAGCSNSVLGRVYFNRADLVPCATAFAAILWQHACASGCGSLWVGEGH